MSLAIFTSDEEKFVTVGSDDYWNSLRSTVNVRLKACQKDISHAVRFLHSGECSAEDALATARQFNIIRDELSRFEPDKIVYDEDDLQKEAPWKDDISSVVTSCANFYTTADGNDLLFEIVKILTYAASNDTSVEMG